MKKILSLLVLLINLQFTFSQESDKLDDATIETLKNNLLKNTSEKSCKCIDSINTNNKQKKQISNEINSCIDKEISIYQLATKLFEVGKDTTAGNKTINVNYNLDKNSKEYKDYYYEIERYLMENCKAIKEKAASNEIENENSVSKKREALVQYDLGIDESKKENYEEAIKYYKKAIKIDPNFAFAYDNIGISYRKLGNYKEAINYYEKSLKIDPNGITPLQNIAVAYQYTKEYDKSIKTYKKLAEIDPQNPEVFYGIGHVYTSYLKEYEKGLDYLCKAYNIYVEQNSPYRSDAETLIQMIYSEMNKAGNKDKFLEILEKNNIKTN
jgi:tetratricopeptide (TPR) repeat protein